MLSTLMKQLSKELELESPLTPQASGNYSFTLDDETQIHIINLPNTYYFYCLFAPCPKENLEVFFTQVLLGDLFGQGTEGAVIGLDGDGETLIISKEVQNQIDYKNFRDQLENFMNSIESWQNLARKDIVI